MEWEFLIVCLCSDEVNELMFNEIEIDKGKSASLLSLSCSTQLNKFGLVTGCCVEITSPPLCSMGS